MTDRARGIHVYPMPEAVTGPYERYALLVREDGEMRMIHSEGVAYEVSADKPWRWNDHTPSPYISREELIAHIETDPVDLADWVRTFGARLENNFSLIRRWYVEAVTTH